MPLSLLNHSALALFAQRTRIPTSARDIGFCAIWVCISSSSSSKAAVQRCRRCIAVSMAVGKGSRDIVVYRIMPSGMASHETLLVILYTHERIFMNAPAGLLVPNKSRSWVWSAGQLLHTRLTYREQQTTGLLACKSCCVSIGYVLVSKWAYDLSREEKRKRKKSDAKGETNLKLLLEGVVPYPLNHRDIQREMKCVLLMCNIL